MAASLAFAALLAIVPLATIAFGLFAYLPSFAPLMGVARRRIIDSFVPGIGDTVDGQLDLLVRNASELPLYGLGALFITAALLMWEVEQAFDAIWKPAVRHSWRTRLLVIWAAITAMPVLAVLFAWTTTAATEAGAGGDLVAHVASGLGAWCVFMAAYTLLPARRVPLGPAAAGAVVAAILFVAAKLGFVIYVQTSTLQSVIYGVLAALPLFQVWLLVVCSVLLFGACVAAEIEATPSDLALRPSCAPDGDR
jgi:membrane protein